MGNQASSGHRESSVGHIDIHDIPDASPFPLDVNRHGSSRDASSVQMTESRESEPPSSSQLQLVPPSAKSPGKKKRGGAHLALAIEEGDGATTTNSPAPYSPRNDAQLGGYPPDCGTAEHKYLSYAKVLHERGQTHPMSFSTTKIDAVGNPVPEKYSLWTDFGAHAFHRLPTDSFVLSQYGVGMTLYFKYLKVMTWLFFILVILSAPALLIYTAGGAQSLDEFKMLAKRNLPAVLGMTTIGHLKDSSSVCDQVLSDNTLSLACPAGEIGFLKAVYSDHDAQGSCTCPEINKVAAGNGLCRGRAIEKCNRDNCTSVCPDGSYGCFLGVHPVSKWSCCATSLDPVTQKPSFTDMRIRETPGCGSQSLQTIVTGLCIGKKSCNFNVSEALSYKWKIDETAGAICPPEYTQGESCEMTIQDESDFSHCKTDAPRGLIVYARCFTTRIDLSKEWSLQIIGWDSISRKDFLGLAVGCDIACSVCFFFVVLWMKRKEKENVARISKDQIKAMDYTVQLVHVPNHDDVDQLRQDIKTHLENLLSAAATCAKDVERIRIADIQFGKSSSRHLELLRERGTVVRKLEVAQQRLEKVKLLQSRLAAWNYNRKLKAASKLAAKLEQRLQRRNMRLERWEYKNRSPAQGGTRAITAFITFEEEEGVQRCLTEYPDLGFLYRLFQPVHKRLHGKRLRFRPAPDPTDIVWENLHHPFVERLLRQLIVALVTLAVLFVSFILILLAKLQKTRLERQFGRPSNCPVGVTKDDVVEDELQKKIGLVPYKVLVECYCKNILVKYSYGYMTREKFYDPSTQSTHFYCKTWATSFISTQMLSFFSVFMVVCVNVLLARILNTLVALEKHHTESGQVVSRITKVFLAQFCNTAILLMIINANLDYFLEDSNTAATNGFGLGSLSIFNGKYDDFTPGWYSDVGVSLMLTMIVNTFSPHVYVVINYLTLKWKRFRDRSYSRDFSLTKQDTQRDLEALYRGPKFDLAARYAQSLTSIFITYLFSAGMPLLHFVGFLEMLMTYWADKFTFLRISRSPPLYDAKVATAAGSLLPYAVVLHSLVAMWMFSNEMIFQSSSDILEELANDDVVVGDGIPSFQVDKGQIFGRVIRPQVVVLFGFCVAFAAALVMRIILFVYFPSIVKSCCPVLTRFTQETKVAKGIPNYFDAIPTNILRDRVTALHVKDSMRTKYVEALARREGGNGSPRKSPRRRNRRSISAAEQYAELRWIVGCPSYAIQDNKEYVEELAIDSYLSEGVPLDRIF